MIIPAVGGIVVIAVVVTGLSLSSIFAKPRPEDQLSMPITWVHYELNPLSGFEQEKSRIVIRQNGEADLEEVALGELSTDDDQRPCVRTGGKFYTGAAKWEINEHGAVRLYKDDLEAVLLPYPARFDTIDWAAVRLQRCEAPHLEYVSISQPRN